MPGGWGRWGKGYARPLPRTLRAYALNSNSRLRRRRAPLPYVLAIDVTVTAACCSLCVRSPRASPAGSAAAPLTADDAAELRALAATAARPSVAAWLLDAAGSLEATSTTTTATAAPAHPAPIAVAAASPPPAAAAAARSYVEPSYGFSADGDDVEVLVMDLAGVGAIPRERVLFDVHGSGGHGR